MRKIRLHKYILLLLILALLPLKISLTIGCNKDKGKKEGQKDLNKKTIYLSPPQTKGEISLEETLQKRRSIRLYKDKDLTLEDISQLLWACQGITEPSFGGRTAPSAGALYPLELYLVNKGGIFHYLPKDHSLEKINKEDVRKKLSKAALNQEFIANAPVSIIITAIYKRTSIKYGKRAERYVKLEAGHACQNLLLQIVALDLGGVPTGAFEDRKVQEVLSLPKDHEPLYIVPIGYPAKTSD